MTNSQLAVGAGVILVVGLVLTASMTRPKRGMPPASGEGVCKRTRRIYAEAEDKTSRTNAKSEGEFFNCPWTTPEGLVQIEVERGNPKAMEWLQRQTA